ncbi:SMI1/KNR4 family protein [Pseudoalteromonas denitrificans]|uniref:Knr4/Smi1-like domain-containing protein n=1 Tax=Pseudoalteromonas denitrificans DSM 6059 TaxID=1123010 RepID=A0A1I1GRD3_9GAMM|nr:SMI1/KNR4 family protein [Pseudoalteromonas denitrificans]SFC11813.1 hypothetical protein SAMN02745724_00924 [Pseudoalteromonas denitrificans DSM 6059]
MNWREFKSLTESEWYDCDLYEGVCGYQIQPETRWNSGLTHNEIDSLQKKLGFSVPSMYRTFLSELNGFDQDCVDFQAETAPEIYGRICYQYPEDLENTKWLLEEIEQNRKYVNEALQLEGFPFDDIEGYIALYGHRALVVFKNKSLSPVISIVGTDVGVYGKSLEEYWKKELCVNSLG